MTILMDSSEPKDIETELILAGIDVERTKLGIGDYVIGNLLIERKTSTDFLASVYDSRLYKQLKQMQDNEANHKPILVIVGAFPPRGKWMRVRNRPVKIKLTEEETERKKRTMIAALSTVYNSYKDISVIAMPKKDYFVAFIVDLYYRQTERKRGLKPVKKKKAESINDYKWNIFSQFPGVGSKASTMLVESGLSIKHMADLEPEDLAKMFKGLGVKRASKIIDILNG